MRRFRRTSRHTVKNPFALTYVKPLFAVGIFRDSDFRGLYSQRDVETSNFDRSVLCPDCPADDLLAVPGHEKHEHKTNDRERRMSNH